MKRIGYIDGRRAFFDDTWACSWGRAKDLAMNWDGTRFNVTQLTADSEIRWGVSGAGIDQRWYGDTVGSYMLWDQSANSLALAGVATLVVAGGVTFLGNLNVQGDVGIAKSLTVIEAVNIQGAVGINNSLTVIENLVVGGNIELSGSLRVVLTARFDSDITIMGSSSTHAVFWHSASDLWAFGMDDHGINVNFYAEATGHGVFWDEDGDTDNGVWSFGATSKGSDVVFWGNTALYRTWWNMDGDTNGQWLFGDDAKGVMVTFNGATTGHLVQWDPDGDSNGEWSFGASTKGVMVKFYGATANFITTFDPNDDTNGSWAFGANTYGMKVSFYSIVTGGGVFWDPDADTNAGAWSFGADGGSKGVDVYFYGVTNTMYTLWDQSANELKFIKSSIAMTGTLGAQGIDEPYISIGTNTSPIEITLTDHVLGVGAWLEAVNSNAHSLIAGYFKVQTDGVHAATLTQLVGVRPRVIIDQDISSAYGDQSTMTISGTPTIAQEACAGSYYLDASGTITTAVRLNALQAMVSGTAAVTVTDTVAGGYDVAWFGASANADVDSILHLYAHDTSSPTQAMLIHTISTTAMNGIIFTTGGSGAYASILQGIATSVPSGNFAMTVKGYMASGASDGVAAYFEGHATGISTGAIYAVGAWLNVDSGTHPVGLYGLDVGVYGADADYTSAYICAASFQTHVDPSTHAPLNHYMLRFNTDAAKDTPDAWFHSANPQAVACADGAAVGNKIASIKVNITGSIADPGYIYLYDAA